MDDEEWNDMLRDGYCEDYARDPEREEEYERERAERERRQMVAESYRW
ncbi:MAG: hypothetical protein M0P69_20465 [Bacteroidales bacterium]|nr:hypothetical protein [Bacteroidales bacterium]